MTEQPPKKPSIALTAATIAAVLTVIYAFNILLTVPNAAEVIGSLTIGFAVTFLYLWVICAGLVWVWRKIKN